MKLELVWFIDGVLWSPGCIFDLKQWFSLNIIALRNFVRLCETIERHTVPNLK